MKSIALPEFQDYLRAKSLVIAKYIPFYANWAIEKSYQLSVLSIQ